MSIKDRPLSPHIQIYKPQITSTLSILHRITGAGLALGAVLVTGWLLAALSGDAAFALAQKFRASLVGQLILFGWLLAFTYHFLNGLRHLTWDTGRGISIKGATRSGWAVVLSALIWSVVIWTVKR